MKITIIYDNTSTKPELLEDWGWSCFVEFNNRKILFDTGGNGKILLQNMLNLSIDPESINDVVISHPDFDHIGGLSTFLNANQNAIIHIPISFRGIRYSNQVKYYNRPTKIYKNIFLTGELAKREQSLAIKTNKGLILVIGCGHPGLGNIINSIVQFGKIYAVIGGLHDFHEFDIINNLEKICPAHCTKYKDRIKQLYPDKYLESGVGTVFEF